MTQVPTKNKYPELIGLEVKTQRRGLPTWPSGICKKRNRVCQTNTGGCGYRFKGGNKTWVCPRCGQDRRCVATKIRGKKACRMHGGPNQGRAPSSKKYMPPQVIREGFNSVLDDPELLTLSHEIGLITSYTQQLLDLIDEQDIVGANEIIRGNLAKIEDAIARLNMVEIRECVQEFYKAIDPLIISVAAWSEIKSNLAIQLPMAKLQNKWNRDNDELMKKEHVMEVLVFMNRITLKYVKDPKDRQAYGKEIISLLPGRGA